MFYQEKLQQIIVLGAPEPDSWWPHDAYAPLVATFLSLFVLTLRRGLCLLRGRKNGDRTPQLASDTRPNTTFRKFADSHGGLRIAIFRLFRLLLAIGLAASVAKRAKSGFRLPESVQAPSLSFALLLAYLYSACLSFAILLSKKYLLRRSLTWHTNAILLTSWTTLFYRDIWPLATIASIPKDTLDSTFWLHFVALSTAALAIPFFIPREYVAVDPKDPSAFPDPEQTSSLASFLTFSFVDPIIRLASRAPRISTNQLPALADYNGAAHLKEQAFPHIDVHRGAKSRHLIFGLVAIFKWEVFVMALATVARSSAGFLAPIALKELIAYFEADSSVSLFRPWVWVILLFVGPMIVSLAAQVYNFYGDTSIARLEAFLVQLIFEHSLRIRMKSDGSEKAPTPTDPNPSTSDAEATTLVDTQETEASSLNTAKASDSEPRSSGSENLVGKINTLITVDVENAGDGKDLIALVIQTPLDLILSLVLLYNILGWSAFVGLAAIVVVLPIPGYLGAFLSGIQEMKLKKTDARVQVVTETMAVVRMIKFFGWEPRTSQRLQESREEELEYIYKDRLGQLALSVITFTFPLATMVLTYGTYVLVMKEPLTASKVFSSMAVFEIIRGATGRFAWISQLYIRGNVSLKRIQDFLQGTEVLDRYDNAVQIQEVLETPSTNEAVGFHNAVFAWSKEDHSGMLTPSSRQFRLRVDDTVVFQRGALNLVMGPTGSGKTSVLMALLGEMHFMPPSVDSWFNLPRTGGVAYAAQESWVQNQTIRDNILFGLPYDESRYKKVVYQCALEPDLALFSAGDRTEVGEKGITLSGGQKSRVTLARAIYSDAEILLLDDVFAALDIHTAAWIVDKCFKGDLIRGRTVILVTHNILLVARIVDFAVAVGTDGRVKALGKEDISPYIAKDEKLRNELATELEHLEREQQILEGKPTENPQEEGEKLIVDEEVGEGTVSWKAMNLYFSSFSSFKPAFTLSFWIGGVVAMQALNSFAIWFLGEWGTQYETHAPEDVPAVSYLLRYTAILLLSMAVYSVSTAVYYRGTTRASRVIHVALVESILGSTLRWLDKTPAGRIITRCTQDIGSIDNWISWALNELVETVVTVVIRLGGPIIFNPIFLVPGLLVAFLGAWIGRSFLRAQIAVRREQGVAKAPVLSTFDTATHGLVSIRAYGAEDQFINELLSRTDRHTRSSRVASNLSRWVAIRSDFLGASFTAALAAYLLANRNLSPANAGFSLNMALKFCSSIIYAVRAYNDFEVHSNSLERIQAYLDIDHEPKSTPDGVPPAAWPTSGELVVERLSARYSANGSKALSDLSFTIKSGERVGIVGRTGSGKSTLTLALLRCILTEGVVYYDRIPTNRINLDALRSAITIIPQMPELLSGSLRRNLDPFQQHDDAVLNNALRSAGLFSLYESDSSSEGRLTLDSVISSGGGNLSVGQRQIIALARAMLRNSKLLIMDEATSAIDHKTDAIIQKTLQNELPADVTVLTVAHRLHTIMNADRVMVLESGRIAEFDSPKALLAKQQGVFRSMVDSSNDKEVLYGMVK